MILSYSIHIKKAFYFFIFLFDKQQYHVCHFNVDTIIRLSVILQYLSFFILCPLRYIKKKKHINCKREGEKKHGTQPNFHISAILHSFVFNKVLRNVVMT